MPHVAPCTPCTHRWAGDTVSLLDRLAEGIHELRGVDGAVPYADPGDSIAVGRLGDHIPVPTPADGGAGGQLLVLEVLEKKEASVEFPEGVLVNSVRHIWQR